MKLVLLILQSLWCVDCFTVSPLATRCGTRATRSTLSMVLDAGLPPGHSTKQIGVAHEGTLPQAEPPTFNSELVGFLKDGMNAYFSGEGREWARFYALETIARVPYFSYLSVLHLYETLGWWRKSKYLSLHFAETWNELHHLVIMEEMGGNDRFLDRVVATHVAFFYYWIAIALYMVNPQNAYHLNEQVERHAFMSYDAFLESHGERLKAMPAPAVAKDYYEKDELYIFVGLDNSELDYKSLDSQRPEIDNMYDVIKCIRDDELEHVSILPLLSSTTPLFCSCHHSLASSRLLLVKRMNSLIDYPCSAAQVKSMIACARDVSEETPERK
ncbi:unnamed protein product [Chrysoparadoxa australica]